MLLTRFKFVCLYFVFAVLYCTTKAQSFAKTDTDKQENTIIYHLVEADLIIDNDVITLQNLKKKSDTRIWQLDISAKENTYMLLYNSKLQEGYLFVEPCKDMSEGCSIYSIKKENLFFLQQFSFAAYNSKNGERMNYNSILPYISIIRSGQRTLLFFDTPIVVFQPNSPQEQILESNTFYHILQKDGFEIRYYQ